jgi:hypothetical protein
MAAMACVPVCGVGHKDMIKRSQWRFAAGGLLGLALIALFQHRAPPAGPGHGDVSLKGFVVLDGDTVRSPDGITYRLLGFDAPETFQARCAESMPPALRRRLVSNSLSDQAWAG